MTNPQPRECCEKCSCKCVGAVTTHYGCDNRICDCHTVQNAPKEDRREEYKRDVVFFRELEEVLDEYFPKIEEEGAAKKANKRGEALMLFSAANDLHSRLLSQAEARGRESALKNVWMLRQWLNEDRSATPMVTNEDILHFLNWPTP